MDNRPNMNYHGGDWAILSAWLEEELQEVYKRLANPATGADETQQLRGRALFIGQLLDFPREVAVNSDR